MPLYWPSCSVTFCLLRLFSLSLLSFYGLVLWGWGLRTDRVLIALPALHCQPLLIIIIIITKTGRLIQPNNLLKVLTAIVQSLSPKIDELIALIQVDNFDVIALNETWLDTQNTHLLAEVAIHGFKVFHADKLQQEGEVDQSCMSKTP